MMKSIHCILYLVLPFHQAQGHGVLTKRRKSSIKLLRERVENSILYDSILKELETYDLKWNAKDFAISLDLSLNPEIYFHTNPETFSTNEYWVHDYEKRKPFLLADIQISAFDWFYTYCDVCITGKRYTDKMLGIEMNNGVTTNNSGVVFDDKVGAIIDSTTSSLINDKVKIPVSIGVYDKKFDHNFLHSPSDFSRNFPRRAFVSIGKPGWNVFIGRDSISWGNSSVGNFIMDKHIDQQDMLRFVIYTEKFKYEFDLLNFENVYVNNTEKPRFFLAHRLEFRPANWINFAVSENLMYIPSTPKLLTFNPAYIFHNLNIREEMNAIAHIELNVTPFRGFNVYAQVVIDQAKMFWESDRESGAMGFSLGTTWSHLFGNGLFRVNAEAIYTTPLLYRRDKVDFIITRTDGRQVLDYMGFPYGGDTMMFHLSSDYSVSDKYKIGLVIEGTIKGEMTMLKDCNVPELDVGKPDDEKGFANYQGRTPSGSKENQIRALTFTLSGEYNIPHLPSFLDISVFGKASFILMKHSAVRPSAKGNDLQLVLGCSVKI